MFLESSRMKRSSDYLRLVSSKFKSEKTPKRLKTFSLGTEKFNFWFPLFNTTEVALPRSKKLETVLRNPTASAKLSSFSQDTISPAASMNFSTVSVSFGETETGSGLGVTSARSLSVVEPVKLVVTPVPVTTYGLTVTGLVGVALAVVEVGRDDGGLLGTFGGHVVIGVGTDAVVEGSKTTVGRIVDINFGFDVADDDDDDDDTFILAVMITGGGRIC